jgi:hypothetical protein
MAKITDQHRQAYNEKAKHYMTTADGLLKNEKMILLSIHKDTPEGAAFKRLTLVDEMLNLASNYIAVNGISQSVLKVKNEEALNDARKSLYKAVIYLEEIVTNYIDVPYSDYEEKLALIESFTANQRYDLIRKMGFSIDLLEQAYGDNSKWRWTFVDMEGRFSTVAKNLLDLRNVLENMEPRSPNYEAVIYHFRLVKKLLLQSATRYREKYELSTGQIHDFKTGINFLAALKRLHTLLYDKDEAEDVKKKLTIWTAKLETDMKKQEESKKNQ